MKNERKASAAGYVTIFQGSIIVVEVRVASPLTEPTIICVRPAAYQSGKPPQHSAFGLKAIHHCTPLFNPLPLGHELQRNLQRYNFMFSKATVTFIDLI